MTSADEDRVWNARDAILLWLYREKIAGNPLPRYNLARVGETVGWAAAPITSYDWDQATRYLRAAGYIDGSAGWGSGVARPSITAKGEEKAASGRSVRPGVEREANTTGVTNTYNTTITHHGHGPVAVNSHHFSQSNTVGTPIDELQSLIEALYAHADNGGEDADEVRRQADELSDAANDPDNNRTRIKASFLSLIGTLTGAAGGAAGQELAQAVLQLMPAFS
ncbi:hypothetical protein IU459_11680 [Nocardia amamiensis]|uniref:Uncharacterized protein n=1 Tax=Nocardia amamiensis TaxID=404578 RepID=A0ABS0CNR9_9NOCA|nr:hypothetical protein [Nocardia amamiensis]MBF6298200.1 hypothetical protein [Nocardia amamiensis]